MTEISLRDLNGMTEFRQAEALQRNVWGPGDKEDPADLMMVIQHEGGLVAGAFAGTELLGYVFGFPTATPGVQHSHRLAVLEKARGLGLGLRLKWYQRDWCLKRGINLVRWTYDPLRVANAALNIGKLGAEAATYFTDYYGEMEGINKGAPSDRILADWHLTSSRVKACAAGQSAPSADLLSHAHRIQIPADFGSMLARDPASALRERLALRVALQSAFERGERIQGYDASDRSYLLMR